jgi:hypothetical protein
VRYQRMLISLTCLGLLASAVAQTPDAAPAPTRNTAVGDLLVAPTRIILDDSTQTAEITLINVGSAKATYRVSFLHQRMSEVGEMKIIRSGEEQPDELFADRLVRFTPRQMVLEPRLAQTLRVQLRIPEGLPDGEYRSHLLFRAVPEAAAPAASDTVGTGQELAIQLHPIYGVSIPLIVRHGKVSAEVTITDLAVEPSAASGQPCVLTLRLNRAGQASTYANVVVSLLPPDGGKAVVVATMGGVAVYTPNASRLLRLPLVLPADVGLAGVLRAVYQQASERGGAVLAEASLQIP